MAQAVRLDPEVVPRCAAVIDLGFGDSGKGLFVDALARRFGTRLVVRFNGGAQAGHNVVLPDGRHHTFSQWAAASFVPGVRTLLAAPVVVHPTALLVEAEALASAGLGDALERLSIDGRCRVTTPYLQAAGRLREWARGAARHGTCGVGFGETVRHALQAPDEALRYADLLRPHVAAQKLEAQRQRLAAWADELDPGAAAQDAAAQSESSVLHDPALGSRWLARALAVARQVRPLSADAAAGELRAAPQVLFEGAQGLLLDEDHGFHPHTTWSRCGPDAVRAVRAEAGLEDPAAGEPCRYVGVLRSYLTRHGAGPMPTEDVLLDALLPEPHNGGDGLQGRFRRGHPDAVLLRYALASAGGIGELAVSHMDALARPGLALRWCMGYRIDTAPPVSAAGERVERLPVATAPDLEHQSRLTALLRTATPIYDEVVIASEAGLLARIEATAKLPVAWVSRGPTHRHCQARRG